MGNEGVVGWTLLVARLGLFCWFVAGIQGLRHESSARLNKFLLRFQIVGSLYFLAYPVIFGVTQVFAPYLQHAVMQIGLVLMQTAAALWLADLFLSRGAYFEVS